MNHDPAPLRVTIVRTRYGVIYEPGKWVAFPMDAVELPSNWKGGDATSHSRPVVEWLLPIDATTGRPVGAGTV